MNVLVTGSSRGIGRAIAVRLARHGGHVVVNFLQNEAAAHETAQLVRGAGAQATVVGANVRSETDCKRLAQTLEHIDVLVHNAAIGALKPWNELRTTHWDLTLESSLRPFWLLTKLAPLVDGASVIGLSSLGSQRFVPGYAAMGAAKAGMEALTRQLAVELAPRRIRVNTVCGGLIRTDTLAYFPDTAQMIAHAEAATPLGRVGEPDDLCGVVDFLVGPDARWITGQVLVVDGGLSLR